MWFIYSACKKNTTFYANKARIITFARNYSKEIQPVHSKGDQSWVFTGRTDAEAETPILWPHHEKS